MEPRIKLICGPNSRNIAGVEGRMIPQEKIAAVTRALHEAFGVTEFEDIRRLTKGTSPAVFRIVVRGRPYLLKFILRTNDPGRKIACMRAAADAGLAPRVWYTSIPDRIAVTDFVEAVPFPVTDALFRMPAVLRALHALPPFPRVPDHLNTTCMFLMTQGPAVEGFIRNFRAANIVHEDESEELFARYAQMAAVYPRHDPDLVSSHNDLFKPDNILFDGQRVWLVDWEAAFLNDRYADLAVVANQVVSNEAEEGAYLQEYFGQPPNSYQSARFYPHAAVGPHVLRHGVSVAGFVRQAARSRVSPRPNSETFIGASGRARSTSGTSRRKPSMAGSIGNGSYRICGEHVLTKHSKSSQSGIEAMCASFRIN